MPVKPEVNESSVARRVVIVTGAGSGLGRAYALDLAARGWRVVVNNRRREVDASGQGSAQQLVNDIRSRGGEAVAEESDVCDSGSGLRMVERALSAWGRLDAVVANAGVDQHQAFHKIGLDAFRAILEVNFFGSLHLVHAAYAHMRARGHGRIVVSTSSAGLHGLHGLSAYAASKAALIALMRSVAAEGRSHDVLCNAIAPYAATRMTAAHGDAAFAERMPPEHLTPLVALLVSEQCRISGLTLVAGGGGFRVATTVEAGKMHRADAAAVDIQAALLEQFEPQFAKTFPDALAAFADFQSSLERVSHADH